MDRRKTGGSTALVAALIGGTMLAAGAVGTGPVGVCSPPTPPLDLAASRGPARGQISLDWDPPANDAPYCAWEYLVYRGTAAGGQAYLASSGDDTAYVDAGLPDGATRWYHVTARNSNWNLESDPSNEDDATSPGVPGAPRSPAASRGPGAGEITVTWDAPQDDGGLPITSYVVYRGEPDGPMAWHQQLAPTARAFTDTGLAAGEAKAYKVDALNVAGGGPFSAIVTQTAPDLPGAPRDAAAVAGDAPGEVKVTWAAPADDGGIPLAAYRVYREAAGEPERLVANVTGTSFTDTGQPAGAPRTYRVRASNAIGEGPASATVTAAAPTLPGAPPDLDAEPSISITIQFPRVLVGGVHLDWEAASAAWGPIKNYRIYRGTDPANIPFYRQVGNVTQIHDNDVLPLTAYYYRVAAKNAAGEGPLSEMACSMPHLDLGLGC